MLVDPIFLIPSVYLFAIDKRDVTISTRRLDVLSLLSLLCIWRSNAAYDTSYFAYPFAPHRPSPFQTKRMKEKKHTRPNHTSQHLKSNRKAG